MQYQQPQASSFLATMRPTDKAVFFGAIAVIVLAMIALIKSDAVSDVFVPEVLMWFGPAGVLIWSVLSPNRHIPAQARLFTTITSTAAAWGAGIALLLGYFAFILGNSVLYFGASSDAKLFTLGMILAFGATLWGAFTNAMQG